MVYMVRTSYPLDARKIGLDIDAAFPLNDASELEKYSNDMEPLRKAALISNIAAIVDIKVGDVLLILRSQHRKIIEITKAEAPYKYENGAHILEIEKITTVQKNVFSTPFLTSLRKPRICFPIFTGTQEVERVIINSTEEKTTLENSYPVEFPIGNSGKAVKLIIPDDVDPAELKAVISRVRNFLAAME